MRSLDITKENLDNQRNAVQEERRLGVDNQPYGKTFEALDELAYDNFAYEHSVIGSMADLNAATVDDVATFFKTYYAPNNAVSRSSATSTPKTTLAKVREVLRADPVAAGAAGGRHDRAAAEGGAAHDARRRAGAAAAHRHGLQDSAELVARRRRADGARDDPVERPQLAVLRDRSSARSSWRPTSTPVRGESRGPGLFNVVGDRRRRASRSRISRRRSTRRSSG